MKLNIIRGNGIAHKLMFIIESIHCSLLTNDIVSAERKPVWFLTETQIKRDSQFAWKQTAKPEAKKG